MSPIEQVLAAAKSIALNGHTPSLALIKGRLGNTHPMPILVQGLQQFRAIPKSEWQSLPELSAIPAQQNDKASSTQMELAQVISKMDEMQNQIVELQQKILILEAQVKLGKN